MSQSRKMSFVESATNSVVAFFISVTVGMFLYPLFGFQVKLHESATITAVYTVISVVRSYVVRRLFNSLR